MYSEHLDSPTGGQSHLTASLFYNTVWISHVIDWILCWKWKTEWLSGPRVAVSVFVVLPGHMPDRQHHRRSSTVSRPGGDQNSKFELQFLVNIYYFCTIVWSITHKLKHHKWGTICKNKFPLFSLKNHVGNVNWNFKKNIGFVNIDILWYKIL